MRIAFATFGCKINQYDTDLMRQDAEEQGSTIVPFDSEADAYVINTCSVTKKADYQCRQKIRAATRRSAGATVIVTGCYAETRPEDIRSIPGVTMVLGNGKKPAIGGVLARCRDAGARTHRLPDQVRRRTRSVLKVQDGCDNRCSYCIVPLARGASCSVPRDRVIRSLDAAIRAGAPEIVLSGIHIGMYGLDLSPSSSLTSLIDELVRRRGPARIRLSSIEPNEITPGIIDLLGKGLCRHLHIPLQSGDDRILKAMNRRYAAADYRELIGTIAARVPGMGLGADVMVGFPGEDDAAFQNTLKLINEIPLTYLHVFSYSPRPGTPAADMDNQVPDRIKRERNEQLRLVGVRKNLAFRRSMIGKPVDVVVEEGKGMGSGLSGLTDNYVRVMIKNGKESSISNPVRVLVKEVSEEDTIGTAIYN